MTLRILDEVVAYVRRMRPVVDAIEKHDTKLAVQLKEALASIALNSLEGSRQRKGKGRNRFEDAMGSADESVGCHLVGDAFGYVKADEKLIDDGRRIAAVLNKLTW